MADDGSAHHVPRSRGVFSEAMDEHVDVVLTVLVKTRKGVIHDRQRAGRLRHAGELLDIGDLRHGIGGAFKNHQSRGMRGQRPLGTRDILDRDHGMRHPEASEQAADEIARRVVGFDEAQDVIALFRQGQQGVRDGTHTRGRHQALFPSCNSASSSSSCRVVGLDVRVCKEPRPLATKITLVSASESNSNLTVW